MEIKSIKDVPDDILNSLDTLLTKDCIPGKYSLLKIRELDKKTDILYLFEDGNPVFFLLLDLYTKHKMLYIHDVCVSKTHRGNSLFKKSLAVLKKHYLKKGYTHFTLDASHSSNKIGLNQKARIYIFHSAGFDLNTETGYFTKSGYKVIKTLVLLDNNEIAEVQEKKGDKYYVTNDKKGYYVKINQIEKCFNSKLKQVSCPMIMYISKSGLGKTKKIKKMTNKTKKKSRK